MHDADGFAETVCSLLFSLQIGDNRINEIDGVGKKKREKKKGSAPDMFCVYHGVYTFCASTSEAHGP